ncbi:MAG: aldehyde dehydrogenase (NADP(+)) [Acidobacteriota bacterium]
MEKQRAFRGINPATGQQLEPDFADATSGQIRQALEQAEQAFQVYRNSSPGQRSEFLHRMADEIEALGAELIERASSETALPAARLTSERARTANQLRMFAQVIEEGSWVEARIDTAIPDRTPIPKPDVRRMLIPLGPIVVFGASNFPLAFSVAGGDTASALAAGNSVVVKAHPAHPGTSDLTGRAILKAAAATSMPEGVFSLLQGMSYEVGRRLVEHPLTRAVGFTGSLKGGRAIFDAANARPEPIPVYAEMGSINPVFVLPSALKEGADKIAQGLKDSVVLGVGQFCTNPGLVIGLEDEGLDQFSRRLAALISEAPAGTMLHSGICQAYGEGSRALREIAGVQILSESSAEADTLKSEARPMIFGANAGTVIENPRLREELFGPSSIVVRCQNTAELEEIARNLEGQLTATIHATQEDLLQHQTLIEILQRKAGRLIFNGYPTGVEVCPSIHHGGPYPATTDARSTSVGTAAIQRFARPIAYQNFPDSALPAELKNRNQRKIWRLVNNEFTKEDVKT